MLASQVTEWWRKVNWGFCLRKVVVWKREAGLKEAAYMCREGSWPLGVSRTERL